MFEILCLQITSAGQLCGFSVRGRPGFGFIFVDLDLLYVSGHTDCLTLIKPLARWDKESSQGPHGTAVSFCPGLSVVTEVNLLSLIWPQSPHASYHMYLLLHWVCFWCLKVCVLSYNTICNTSQMLHLALVWRHRHGPPCWKKKPACDELRERCVGVLASDLERIDMAATNLTVKMRVTGTSLAV